MNEAYSHAQAGKRRSWIPPILPDLSGVRSAYNQVRRFLGSPEGKRAYRIIRGLKRQLPQSFDDTARNFGRQVRARLGERPLLPPRNDYQDLDMPDPRQHRVPFLFGKPFDYRKIPGRYRPRRYLAGYHGLPRRYVPTLGRPRYKRVARRLLGRSYM